VVFEVRVRDLDHIDVAVCGCALLLKVVVEVGGVAAYGDTLYRYV
jgi:hypothetical protein